MIEDLAKGDLNRKACLSATCRHGTSLFGGRCRHGTSLFGGGRLLLHVSVGQEGSSW